MATPVAAAPLVSRAARMAGVADLIAVGGTFAGAICRLIKSAEQPSSITVWADLQEADFPGYAPSGALAWGQPYIDAAGVARVAAPSHQFFCTGDTPDNLIYGYALTDGAAQPALLQTCWFSSPVPMARADAALTVVPEVIFPPPQ